LAAQGAALKWRIKNCIDKWLNPNIGSVLLANVTNSTLKELVAKMHASGLSAKTIINYAQVVKLVVGSAVDANGEELFPRKWNSEFIDMPTLGEQKNPTFSEAALAAIVSASTGQQQVVYALLAGGGMRVGEVLGLEIKHLSDDCSTISVKQSAWEGDIQAPKTPAAVRKVDVYSAVAQLLKDHVGNRTSGLVFPSRRGTPILQSNFARRDFHPLLKKLELPKTGFHAFRRFRTTWLRKNRAPEDLIRFWLGHADKTVTGGYSKLGEDAAFRKSVAESIGCGFKVPEKPTKKLPSVRSVRKNADERVFEKVA
jgi:integrase